MLQGLRTVVYPVQDLAQAKAWYAAILDRSPYFDAPFYVGFNVGGYELGLLPVDSSEDGGDRAVTYWGVANADEAFTQLLTQGATEHESVHDVGEGIRLGSVIDPFGNIVGVIDNPHFVLTP